MPSITHTNKLRISPAWNGMRFEFLEPPRSLQPNLTSAETSGVIPLLKKLVQVHIYFFARKGGFGPSNEKTALYVEKKKFKDGKNRLESANQPGTLKSL